MERADKIVEWAISTGRNPTDTAGMDSDDEIWLGENSEWQDYIMDQWNQHNQKQKQKQLTLKKPQSRHKYPYPEEFFKKDGSLKTSNKKKRLQWLKQYKIQLESGEQLEPEPQLQLESAEQLEPEPQLQLESAEQLEPEPQLQLEPDPQLQLESGLQNLEAVLDSTAPPLDSGIEDVDDGIMRLSNLHEEFDDQLLDQYVFDNKGRILTYDSCKKMRDYCELYPRKCYLEREFLEKYVRMCRLIGKTNLYIDDFYNRLPEDKYIYEDGMLYGNPFTTYLLKGPSSSQPWRGVRRIDSFTRSGDIPIDRIILEKIPKSQIPDDAKKLLIKVIASIPGLSGGQVQDRYNLHYIRTIVFRNGIREFVRALSTDKLLMIAMVHRWRYEMATNTNRKPKTIEEIIRRFIKNL